jgi:C-terminal processing protease CtpA/Prc
MISRAQTRETRLAVFDDVWTSVRERYYDSAFDYQSWDALARQSRPIAADAQTTRDFYNVLRRLLTHLHDSHTRVYAPDEQPGWPRLRYVTTGLTLREVEGQTVIASVEPDSEAERQGIRAGDILLTIDGQEPRSLVSRLLSDEISASLPSTARFQAFARLLDGPRQQTVSLTFAGQDGRPRAAQLPRRERERPDELQLRKLSREVWLARFDAFTPKVSAALTRACNKNLRHARALILDLRNNGGGEAEVMTEIASAFLPAETNLGNFTDRANRVFLAPRTRSTLLFSPDPLVRFTGPVVILTSEKTASAAEVMIAAFKEQNRALVIGTRTCGCVLGVRRHHQLPDGGTLDLSETDYRTARGSRLEGTGIVPDEIVPLTLRDLRERRDAALQRARELLKNK